MATSRRRRGKSDGSLEKAKVAVTFAKGVDQVTAEKLVVPGSMTRMENGVYNKVGEVQKRNGYDDLSADVDINYPGGGVVAPYDGPVVLTGESAGVLDEELLLFDGNRVFSRSTEDINWTFVDQATPVVTRSERTLWGSSSPGDAATQSYERIVSDQHAYQCVHHNGYSVYIWADEDPTTTLCKQYFAVVDSNTGDRIVNSQVMGSFSYYASRLVTAGQYVFFVGTTGPLHLSPGRVEVWRMDTLAFSARNPWPFNATPYTDAHLTHPFMDAVEVSATEIAIAYVREDPQVANYIRTFLCDTAVAGPFTNLNTAEECDRCLSLYRDPNNGNLGIAWVHTHTPVANVWPDYGYTVTEDVKMLVWDAALTPGGPWPVNQPGPLGMLINREVGVEQSGTARHISLGPGCNDDYYTAIWDTALGVNNPGWHYLASVGADLRLRRYAAYTSKVMIRQCRNTLFTNAADYDINGVANGIIGQTGLPGGGNDGFNPNIYYASLASRQFLRGDEVFFSVVQPTQPPQAMFPERAVPYAAYGIGQTAPWNDVRCSNSIHVPYVDNLEVGMTLIAGDNGGDPPPAGTATGVTFDNNGVDFVEFTITAINGGVLTGTFNVGNSFNWDTGGPPPHCPFLYIKESIVPSQLPVPVTAASGTMWVTFPNEVVPVVQNSTDQFGVQSSSYALMRMSRIPDITSMTGAAKYSAFGTCSIVGKMAESIAGGVHTHGAVSRVSEVGVNTEKWVFAGGEVALIRSDQAEDLRNIRMVSECTIDMGDMQSRYESLEKNKTRLTCGGELATYDGEQFTAPGWVFPPTLYSDTYSITYQRVESGDATAVLGTIGIRAVYEWYDNAGQRHQSAPSREIPFRTYYNGTTTADEWPWARSVTVDAAIYGWLPKDTRVVLYQTAIDQVGIGPYYRTEEARAFPCETLEAAFGGVQSSFTQLITNFEPKGLSDNEILYTNGDVLVNDDAPSSTCIEEWDERVWLGGLEVQNEVAFSKTVFTNEGIFFNNVLRVAVGSELERVVALQAMDDKLVVFKENSIYIIYGDGPNDLGQGATYRAQLVTTDQGCTGPKSVVLTPSGILFNTQAGIYRLQRGLQVDFIGARVEDTTAGVTFHGADLVPQKTQARFMLSSGNAVVYDYLVDAWYTFTNHLSAGGGCCVVWKDLFSFINAGGAMNVQNTGYLDSALTAPGTYIPTLLETAWIKSGDVEGLQRVYKGLVLGEATTGHTMTIDVGFDYDAYLPADTKVWSAADIAALPRYQLEIRPSRQRCQAIRFRMQDSGTPPAQNAGYIMTYLMLEVGIQSGLYRRYPILEARK